MQKESSPEAKIYIPASFQCGACAGGRDAFPRAALEGTQPLRAFASVIAFLQLLEASNIIET